MHPGQKLKPGARVRFEGAAGVLHGEVLERQFFGRRTIRLTGGRRRRIVDALVDALGHVPLPPYIQRRRHARGPRALPDRLRATTAARSPRRPPACTSRDDMLVAGSTPAVSSACRSRCTSATAPSSRSACDDVEAHVVDPEPYEISEAAAASINRALDEGRRVVAVGTTTTRALEDAAARGNGRWSRPARARRRSSSIRASTFQDHRRAHHQLPPAEVVAADAGGGLRRPRDGAGRLPRGRRAARTASTAMATRCW